MPTRRVTEDNLRLAEKTGRRATHDKARFSMQEVFSLFPVVHERRDSMVGLLSGGQQLHFGNNGHAYGHACQWLCFHGMERQHYRHCQPCKCYHGRQ